MNKLILLAIAIVTCTSVNAQEQEKKKESNTPSNGSQERSINESGISVKSKPQTKSNATVAQPVSTVTPVPTEEKKKEVKKPQ